MKIINKFVLLVSLTVGVNIAHANMFETSITGPASVLVGQENTYNLHVQYDPTDVKNWLDTWGDQTGYITYTFKAHLNSYVQALAIQGVTLVPLSPTATSLGYQWVSDPLLPVAFDVPFSWEFSDTGNYLLHSWGSTGSFLEVQTMPTAKCFAEIGSYCFRYADNFGAVIPPQAPNDGYLSVSVSAVPEPETFALMLAGLGLVGVVARRRQAIRS